MAATARILLTTVVGVSAIGLAGCSKAPDPATEAPVAMQPGRYKVAFRNNGAAMNMAVAMAKKADTGGATLPGAVKEGFCVSGDDDAAKIDQLLQTEIGDKRNCSLVQSERKGNAVGGKLSCPFAPDFGTSVEYTGHLTTTSLSVEGAMTMYSPGDRKSAPVMLTAERIGDC